ncbi:MAG TPA: SDR family oxidoreductase [Xanthobacteraceae bacterium]|jgi:NAD(P)-dependent dehydrogenase (short-subunit alcohol dehydrogenase family)|nr:SDR family oxidoreductase [Xanthobacteraceae bacterium]
MAGTLDGKVAIVTGAGRGLGQVMTLGLLEAGARVAAVEIDAPALEETESAADQRGSGERIQGVVADITRDDSAPKIVRATTEHFGRLDILINNAGINTSLLRPEGQPVGKFWEVTPAEFRRVIDVNVVAAFLMTRAALPVVLKQGWGRIINVTTSLDTMYRAAMQPYGGSKAANEAHLLAMAQELEGSGVSANVLVPGGAANTRLVSRTQEPDRGKLIPPEVMVAPLIWLCSNASDGVNGQRFIGMRWDKSLPPEEAAKNAGAPMAWQQLGRQAIMPDRMS